MMSVYFNCSGNMIPVLLKINPFEYVFCGK